MDASVRELKSRLSAYLRRVAGGESVTVRVRRRAVAKLVPVGGNRSSKARLMSIPGVHWNGGKPRGYAAAQRMPKGVSLAEWVSEDRR